MKKNTWLTPKGITAVILMVGALAGAIVVTATYITLPKDVEAVQMDLIDLKEIIQRQQIINDYYYEKEQQPYQQPQQQYQYQQPQYKPSPQNCQYDEYGYYWCWNGYEWEEV